jgi:outer membrane protein assembly factor BamB
MKVEAQREFGAESRKVFPGPGGAEVLFQSSDGITAYDPQTGEIKWRHSISGLSTICTPVTDGRLVLAPANGQLLALRPSEAKAGPEEVWKSNKLHSAFASPVHFRGRVYAVNNTGVVNCVDAADGKLVWQSERTKGPYSSSPLVADGKLYLVNEEGLTTVLQIGDKPRVLATNALSETMLASPAVFRDAIFLRSDRHLFCIANEKSP